jgi:hypothetical protein
MPREGDVDKQPNKELVTSFPHIIDMRKRTSSGGGTRYVYRQIALMHDITGTRAELVHVRTTTDSLPRAVILTCECVQQTSNATEGFTTPLSGLHDETEQALLALS